MTAVSYKPLYLQVKEILLQRIDEGVYPQEELIPSESGLAREFGTSISTIRQAISMLSAEGMLIKKQGKGTYVSHRKTTIRFFCWLGNTQRDESRQIRQLVQEVIALFHQKYPSIEVECLPAGTPFPKKTLLNLITSGNAPDVALIMTHWTSYFASMGAFTRLEPLLNQDNPANRGDEKDLSGGLYRKQLYSAAWGVCPVSMIANMHVLQQAEITLPELPMTLDTFSAICQRVDQWSQGQEKYSYALSLASDHEDDFLAIYPFLLAFRGGLTNTQGEIRFDSPENIAAFSWLRDFIKNCNVLQADISTIRKRFAQEAIAFISDGPWIKTYLEELTGERFEQNFRVVLNPVIQGKFSFSWNNNYALAICSQSQHPGQAAKFIDAMTNDEEICTYFSSRLGMLPVNKHFMKDPGFSSSFFRGYRQQLAHTACINAQNAMFAKAMSFCHDTVRQILEQGADIKQELKEKEKYLHLLYEE